MLDASQDSLTAGAPPVAPEVARERCEFIYRRAPAGVGAAILLSILLAAYLWRLRPAELILEWQAFVFICAGAFGVLLLAYRRSSGAKENPQLWIRRAAFGAAALGASWGFAAAAFFPGAQEEQVLIAFVVALVTAGGLPLFSTVWWVYAVYAGAMLNWNK